MAMIMKLDFFISGEGVDRDDGEMVGFESSAKKVMRSKHIAFFSCQVHNYNTLSQARVLFQGSNDS